MKDCITDGINKLRTTYDDPIIFIGGDTNKRSLTELVNEFRSLKLIDTPPTRGNVILDETATNIADLVKRCKAYAPLCTEDGVASDHKVVIIEALIPSIHHFTKRHFKFRPITEKGKKLFESKLTLLDWTPVYKESASESALAICQILDSS